MDACVCIQYVKWIPSKMCVYILRMYVCTEILHLFVSLKTDLTTLSCLDPTALPRPVHCSRHDLSMIQCVGIVQGCALQAIFF